MSPDLPPESSPSVLSEGASNGVACCRWRRLLILAAVVCCLGFSLTFPFPLEARYWGALFNLAHAPSFCFVFLLVAGVIDPSAIGLSSDSQPLISLSLKGLTLLAVILCALGIIGELAQSLVSRLPSLLDVLANCSGLLAGMSWSVSRRIRRLSARWPLAMAAPVLVAVPGISPTLELRECILQTSQFPLLASFERSQELNAWSPHQSKVSMVAEWASEGMQSMRIDGNMMNPFPGASMVWPVNDWSEYSQLHLDIHNPQNTGLTVGISISDIDHRATGNEPSDRYQKSFPVEALSTKTVSIELSDVASAPATRSMVMSKICLLDIFVPAAAHDTTMFVDNIRLTKPGLNASDPD